MVSNQVADAEGDKPYFVMRVSLSGATSWQVYRRGQGTAVKVGFRSASAAQGWADKMNRKAGRG